MKIAILSLENQTNADAVTAALRAAGHDCALHDASRIVPDELRAESWDLLVVVAKRMSVHLPELTRALKGGVGASQNGLPVLAVIDPAGFHAEDLVALLSAGVDEYLVQPVRRTELALRVDVLLRRAWPEKRRSGQMEFGPFVFDTLSGSVRRDGRLIALAHKEFELALLFFRHLDQPLSRATLLDTLWPREAGARAVSASRTVDTHVSRVRNKLGLQPGLQDRDGFHLVPVYGYGYVLEKTVSAKQEVGI